MKILIAGDTHGDARNVKQKIDFAKEVGDITRVVILGDFGLWWGLEGINFIDDINIYAKNRNVQIFAIPGNHENYTWWNSVIEGAPAKSKGWAYLRTHVLLSPRVHDFVWGGKQFFVAGGAVSIDKDYRIEYERKKGKKIWSPDEQLTDEEVEAIKATRFAHGVPVDYLFTHDCSDMTDFKNRLKPDHDSVIHRQRIDTVIRTIKPKKHFHGHMHEKYDWVNDRVHGYSAFMDEPWDGPSTHTYGLECNSDDWSWGVLDTETDEFTWGVDLLNLKPLHQPKSFDDFEIDDDF